MSDGGSIRAHPDFARAPPPERASVGGFDLAPLATAIVEEDFAVVSASAAALRGLFGDDWPDGLTLEDNARDLAWHEREFAARRSFAWVLREGPLYAGCLYAFPRMGERGVVDVWFWLRSDGPDWRDRSRPFQEAVAEWIAGPDWPDVATTFHT